MNPILLAGALALTASSALAQTGNGPAAAQQLDLEQKTSLRCSAAFAIIASEQARGVKSALAYPPLGERGKEFFVRTSARLMGDLKLSREQVQALYMDEVGRLQNESMKAKDPQKAVSGIMQPCLLLLDASGI
ncbi:hypothetical protein SZ64_15295 [Erythrobacter sp. SG61-1L]|uniref:hypothetical protein n=1 Tax=Erythrobacter sp. SG61-1L TaxID=1603897 RepID=UPI0006C90A0C|nr:hypothetical protein [Erythrobacter sp. SG61-1L]KPL69352.1 hypothetical protein SZ64_15295 [Erythrobacter sp. SG61-1L]